MKTKSRLLGRSAGMGLLLLIGLILFSAFKSTSDSNKAKLVGDIRTYLDKNVKPVMQPQRIKLNQSLTTEEIKEVAQLNQRLRQLIIKRNSSGVGFITSPDFSFNQQTELSPVQKAEMKEGRDEMRRIMASAWTIADRHETEINKLLREKSSFYGTWQRGLTSIVKEYLDDKFIFIGSNQLIRRFESRELVKYYTPVAFLLWDPQQHFITDDLIKK